MIVSKAKDFLENESLNLKEFETLMEILIRLNHHARQDDALSLLFALARQESLPSSQRRAVMTALAQCPNDRLKTLSFLYAMSRDTAPEAAKVILGRLSRNHYLEETLPNFLEARRMKPGTSFEEDLRDIRLIHEMLGVGVLPHFRGQDRDLRAA